MAFQRKNAFIRGRRARLTKVGPTGAPVFGDESVVVTKGIVTIGYTSNIEEGEAVSVPNFGGESCISEAATPQSTGVSVEVEFCDVDFAAFNLVTGQPVVLNEDGEIIGITENLDVDLSAVAFALEVWLGVQTDAIAAAGSEGFYGYVLTPFLSGGVIGDVTVENGAISFTVTGMNSKSGSAWGSGPYNVELVSGVPAPLRVPLTSTAFRRTMRTEVAPPEVFRGLMPLLDPTDAEVTSIAAVATGLSVAIDPTPAGTDPMWYDFGDGTWDYAATGSYTKVYAAAGTYTIVGHRGDSSATVEVTVTA